LKANIYSVNAAIERPSIVKEYLKIPETVNEKPIRKSIQPPGFFKAIFLDIFWRTNIFKANTHDKMDFI
jgi:energy-converting hydrogenase Eha subunit A